MNADGTMYHSNSISAASGWLTIEYSSFENLRSQLLSLAQTIDTHSEETLPFRIETPPRRSSSMELRTPARKAQSA